MRFHATRVLVLVLAVAMIAVGLPLAEGPSRAPSASAVDYTPPDLEEQKALLGLNTSGGRFAVGKATVMPTVALDGDPLDDGVTRRSQLIHARGFDGTAWSWEGGEDPDLELAMSSLGDLLVFDRVECPAHPDYDCYPGLDVRAMRPRISIRPTNGIYETSVEFDYFVSDAMREIWNSGWHRYATYYRSDGSHCSGVSGWSSGHTTGWHTFAPSIGGCRGTTEEPADVAVVRFGLGRPNLNTTFQYFYFQFLPFDPAMVQGQVVTSATCVNGRGETRRVTERSEPYVLDQAPPTMPGVSCGGNERLSALWVTRRGVDPSPVGDQLLLSYEGSTFFGFPNATLTAEQMRAGAYPAGSMADPVDTATGELYEHYTDVSVSSYGPDVAVSRTYSSADATGGLLGPGWRLGYETSLSGDLDGSGGNEVVHTSASGAQLVYVRQGDGSFVTPPGASDVLAQTAAGFELRALDGSMLVFDVDGKLTSAVDDQARAALVAYHGDGQIAAVTAPNGRQLTFTTASTAHGVRLTGVASSDGRAVTYDYDNGWLTGFTDLRGETWTYRYDTDGRLDRETDPEGNHLHTTTYDADGRVIEQVDARGGVSVFEWGLDDGTGWVTMTDPEGYEHTDFYYGYVTVARYMPDGRRTAYHYDEQARLTSLDLPDGTTAMYDYDADGRMIASTHVAASALPAGGRSAVATETSTVASELSNVFGLAADPDGEHVWVGRPGQLDKIEIATGDVVASALPDDNAWLWNETAYDLAEHDGVLYLAVGRHNAGGTSVQSKVFSYDLGDGTSTLLAELGPNSNHHIGGITVAPDGTVFFTRQIGDPGVFRITSSTPGFELVHSLAGSYPGGITADADRLYVQVTDGVTGKIVAMDHDGDGPVTLLDDLPWNAVETPTVSNVDRQSRALLLVDRRLVTSAGQGKALFQFDLDSERLVHLAGGSISGSLDGPRHRALFDRLHSFATVDGNLFVLDTASSRVAHVAVTESEAAAEPDPYSPERRTAETVYDLDGNVVSTTDPAGRETTYEYDQHGQVTAILGPDGVPASFAYDARGLLVSMTLGDPSASTLTTTYEYDPTTGDLLATTDPAGATTRWERDTGGRVTKIIAPTGSLPGNDPDDYATDFVLDPAGLVLSATDALNRTLGNVYDRNGRLVETIDAAGRTVSYSYDAAGNVTEVHGPDPDRPPIVTDYDGLGRPIAVTDAAGRTATRTYDALSRIIEVTDPTGTATLDYADHGQLTAATDQAGRTTNFDYDLFGQLTRVRYPDQTTIAYTYDDAGRLTETVDATGTTTYVYDDIDRPATVVTPAGEFHYGYDGFGRLVSRIAPDGRVETRTYQNALLESVALDGVTVADYLYDPIGTPTGVALGNGITESIGFDTVGRVETLQTRDPAGELVHRADYSYDVLGRPVTITDERSVQAFTYDQADRLTRVCFDVAVCDGAETDWIAYSYDAAGNRATEQHSPIRTFEVTLAGTASGSGGSWQATITAATEPAVPDTTLGYQFESSRGVTGESNCTTDTTGTCTFEAITLPNNDSAVTFSLTTIDGTPVDAGEVTLHRNGEPVAIGWATNDTTRTYTYDHADRLSDVHLDHGDGPALETDFVYDQVGNTVRAGEATHAWDVAGRLIATDSGGVTTEHDYDARGLRVSSRTPTVTTDHVWDPLTGELIATATNEGTDTTTIRYLPGGHGHEVNGATHYFHTDVTSNLQAITDETGSLLAGYDYEPFGTIRAVHDHSGQPVTDATGTEHTTRGFHGHYHDPSGLVYMQARYYDPTTGRFLSLDPAGGGYTYGFNNPITNIDPDGLWAWSAVGEHASTASQIAGWVAVGAIGTAVVIGAPFTAPLLVGTLWASGAVVFGGEVINAAHVCGAGKGGCGSAVAMAGLAAVGGNTVRPLRAVNQARQATATVARQTPAPRAASGAESAAQGARLREHLRLSERYGTGAVRELPDGRIRYYGELRPANKPGEMSGLRVTREWDPSAGNYRTWMETLDHSGRVRQVHPYQPYSQHHYMFDEFGNYVGRR